MEHLQFICVYIDFHHCMPYLSFSSGEMIWQIKSVCQVLEGLPERDMMDFVTVETTGVVARGSWLEGEGDEMEDESAGAMDEDDESIEVRE